MAKHSLVIVESPAKAKTIGKYLGKEFEVKACMGHLRDLPKSTLGVDLEHDFEPVYKPIKGKEDIIADLKKSAKSAEMVYLATDPDREGEAISWHLKQLLNLPDEKTRRVTFNEITKNVVQESIREPRDIDQKLVDAQQARRILDRIVGYELSPLLWKKIRRGLSAGRVQSVATRMVDDRDREIEEFKPEEYWTLDANLFGDDAKKLPFAARYHGKDGKKAELKSAEDVDAVVHETEHAPFTVKTVKRTDKQRSPSPPFTTSTMQQEASRKLSMTPRRTMAIAQQLYEGVDIEGEGTVGLITYMRTDSLRLSDEALAAAKDFIQTRYGAECYPPQTRHYKTKVGAQDAHEAIRPTDITLTPTIVKESLQRDLFRLYQLIWKRFTASRMAPAVYGTTSVKIGAGSHLFTTSASKLDFEGFMSVYVEADDEEEKNQVLGNLEKGTVLKLEQLDPSQHFTQPPAHYTEASLVKALEEQGIGRPSTYAPTITTIIARRYVVKESKNLYVTELGEVVNHMMKEAFPAIVDVNFTANMETLLDGVEEGTVKWKTIVENFYPDLDAAVKKAEKDLAEVTIADEESDEVCELCGRRMVIKYGPHGRFLACPGFPECRNTKPYFEKIGVACPKCGKDIVMKKTKKGRRYYGCIDNPECDFMVWQKPSGEKCPRCGKLLLEKGNKLVCMDEQCGYVKNKPTEEK